jgi:hypothetical protein
MLLTLLALTDFVAAALIIASATPDRLDRKCETEK